MTSKLPKRSSILIGCKYPNQFHMQDHTESEPNRPNVFREKSPSHLDSLRLQMRGTSDGLKTSLSGALDVATLRIYHNDFLRIVKDLGLAESGTLSQKKLSELFLCASFFEGFDVQEDYQGARKNGSDSNSTNPRRSGVRRGVSGTKPRTELDEIVLAAAGSLDSDSLALLDAEIAKDRDATRVDTTPSTAAAAVAIANCEEENINLDNNAKESSTPSSSSSSSSSSSAAAAASLTASGVSSTTTDRFKVIEIEVPLCDLYSRYPYIHFKQFLELLVRCALEIYDPKEPPRDGLNRYENVDTGTGEQNLSGVKYLESRVTMTSFRSSIHFSTHSFFYPLIHKTIDL